MLIVSTVIAMVVLSWFADATTDFGDVDAKLPKFLRVEDASVKVNAGGKARVMVLHHVVMAIVHGLVVCGMVNAHLALCDLLS